MAASVIVDVVFPACNRLAFTRIAFECLLENTNWELVRNLIVYDDASTDGTREYLRDRVGSAPVQAAFVPHSLGGPVKVMEHYLAGCDGADVFAKVDNDIAMPKGWLDHAAAVMDADPELDLLGLAAGWTATIDGEAGWRQASHIGGVGLMRVASFDRYPRLAGSGRQGFTQWQHIHWVNLRVGWILPDVNAPQLDLIPVEPFASLSAAYTAKGWQRQWPQYMNPEESHLWEWVIE